MVDAKNQICYRDRVTVHTDAAAEGATNPSYSEELCRAVPAEVRQVSGGEVIRGKQVEAITQFVVSFRNIPTVAFSAKDRVTVLSGPFKNQYLFVHRVHFENMHGRPVRVQLHCKANV